MYSYINGEVVAIEPSGIVLDNNGIGYFIYVANPYYYKIGEKYKVYLYNHIREDENSLFGFTSEDEKKLFLKLINVKGLGPRTALPMFASSVDALLDAIARENLIFLTKFPKIGDKVARQIILDLKGKLVQNNELFTNDGYTELIGVLESLGYKKNDIKNVLPKVDPGKSVEEQVKDALKLLLR